ncbi:septin-2A-like isoform X3 [Carassius auratus]|uniref:Septin-7 n=1 Tax=Carassius auratus TaxID=7957 RepID=A0A6P6ITZ0_CARAU|nr:septin-2A-like isoform X3 [Carassius auratus]
MDKHSDSLQIEDIAFQVGEFSITLNDSGMESLLRDPDTSLCDSTEAEDKYENIHSSHIFGSSSSLAEDKTHPANDKSPLRPKSPGGSFDPPGCLEKYVGIVTLPNQVQQKAVKKGFVFNLMVVGESGLGKSTLVNSLFHTNLYMDRCMPGVSEKIARTVSVTKNTIDIVEEGVNLRLTVIDTPGFGDAINNHESWKAAVHYVDQEMEKYRKNEIGLNRKNITDNRVHCCLYFISPHGHGLKPIDVNFMKALDQKVNIVPVLAKADSLTPKETSNMKAKILSEIDKFKIRIFQVSECDTYNEDLFKQQTLEIKRSIPFAVIGSSTVVERNGRRVRARVYPWGTVEVENPSHSDFVHLRNMLIRTHMQDLIHTTHYVLYENYRINSLCRNPFLENV